MANVFVWILFGALAGWIAALIMRTNNQQRLAKYILAGIAGALLGGATLKAFTSEQNVNEFNFSSLLVAIIGSTIVLIVVRKSRGTY